MWQAHRQRNHPHERRLVRQASLLSGSSMCSNEYCYTISKSWQSLGDSAESFTSGPKTAVATTIGSLDASYTDGIIQDVPTMAHYASTVHTGALDSSIELTEFCRVLFSYCQKIIGPADCLWCCQTVHSNSNIGLLVLQTPCGISWTTLGVVHLLTSPRPEKLHPHVMGAQ